VYLFIVIPLAIVYALAVGFMTRRLLGAPVGWPRTFVVGLVVFAASVPFTQYTAGKAGLLDGAGGLDVHPVVALAFILLAFGWTFAFGVAFLVGTEAIWPTASVPNPIYAFQEAVHRRRRTQRYLQILAIASRHGVGHAIHGHPRRRTSADATAGASVATNPSSAPSTSGASRSPDAIVSFLNDAGVTFVKLGQVMSTRRDLLPPRFIEALSSLQTSATTLPWSDIERVVERELGRPLGEVFTWVDNEPLAAASVAQVHRATLLDGTDVVLKVQRPDAERQVRADVDIILRIADRIEAKTSWGAEFGAVSLANGFAKTLEEELDYRIEFGNTEMIRSAVEHTASHVLSVPRVFAEASSRRVLTQERVDGIPLGKAQQHLASMPMADRQALAEALLDAVLQQVIVEGVFHADLHPGNLILREDGTLGMIDFGAIGVLERSMREALATLLLAAASEDDVATTDALLLVVTVPEGTDTQAMQREIGKVLTLMRHRRKGDGSIFSVLLDVIRAYHLGLPASLSSAFRTIVTLDGCLTLLDPDFDLVDHALKRVPHFMRHLLSPERLFASAQAQAATSLATLRKLPRRIESVSSRIENGTFSVRVRSFATGDDRWWVSTLVSETVGVLIAITAVVVGIVLVVTDSGPYIVPDVRLFAFLGSTIGLVGFILILRSLRRVFLTKPR
jgi:ubiquinone biosynthesis protein